MCFRLIVEEIRRPDWRGKQTKQPECFCLFQGDERGRRQSGWCQQSTRHRLHRLPNVTKHRRQRQGNTHTQSRAHSQTHCERVCRAVVWPHCCCSWLGVCFWCSWGSFHYSWSDSFKKLSLLCSPDEVRLIYFTCFSLVGSVAVTSDLGNSDPAGLCSDLWDS